MAQDYCWKTIAFAPAQHGLELRNLGADVDDQTVKRRVVGWLTQEQVDGEGNLAGVAAVRVIAGYLRPFSDTAPAEEQEDDDGWLAAEVMPADEPGWHVFWDDQPA
jgi:hypothetical protein